MKISQLGNAGTITGSEVFPIVQGGETKKVSITDALAGAGGGSTGVNGLNGSTNIGLGGTLTNVITTIDCDNNAILINNAGQGSKFMCINDLNTNLESGFRFPNFTNDVELYTINNQNSNSKAITLNNDSVQINTSDFGALGFFIDFANANQYFGYNQQLISTGNIAYLFFDGTTGNGFFKNSLNDSIILGLDVVSNKYYLSDGAIEAGIKNDGNSVFYTALVADGTIDGLRIDIPTNKYNLGSIVHNFDIFVDANNKTIKIGDYQNLNNLNQITLDETLGDIFVRGSNSITLYQYNAGLALQGGQSKLCDPDGNGNGSYFGLDDSNQCIIASANLLTNTSGSSSGQHLMINVNGINYVIELKNP